MTSRRVILIGPTTLHEVGCLTTYYQLLVTVAAIIFASRFTAMMLDLLSFGIAIKILGNQVTTTCITSPIVSRSS